jgi:putative ABC transport system permease protein
VKILTLAWRNVFRHTRRTIITAVAISVGLTAMIFMNTMMNGIDTMAYQNIVQYETSHMEVFAKGYYREEGVFPLDTIIENPAALISKITTVNGVKSVTPRVKFQARVNNGVDELPLLAIGIDRALETGVFQTARAVVAGQYLQTADDLLIGVELAEDIGADLGSFLTVITRDRNGTYNAYDFVVTGLINTGHPLFDRNAVLIDLTVAQQLVAIDHGVTELCVRSLDDARREELKHDIASAIGEDYEVLTFREMNASIFEVSGLKRTGQTITALIVVVIAAVGIINTMLMAVMERVPEIGTLKALGFSNVDVVKMFVYEGGIIGIFGSVIGCLCGILFSLYIVVVGLDLTPYLKGINIVYPVKFLIKGELDFGMILLVFLFGVVVSVLVTLWPVRKATALEPVDALRHT